MSIFPYNTPRQDQFDGEVSSLSHEELLRRDDESYRAAQEYAPYAVYMSADRSYKQEQDNILSAIMVDLEKDINGRKEKVSQSRLEMLARATKEWTEYIERKTELLKTAAEKKIMYEASKQRFEAYRSAISLKKKELEKL